MTESFYVYETKVKHARTCEVCGGGMNDGYLHEETSITYCSTYCVTRQISVNEFLQALKDEELFWTTWHDEVEGSG